MISDSKQASLIIQQQSYVIYSSRSIFHLIFVVCPNGAHQSNDYNFCKTWFDYNKGCNDETCDGNTRMSLTSESIKWMKDQHWPPKSSILCTLKAPWPLSGTNGNGFDVKLLCQQICDYCLPLTTTIAVPTTTRILSLTTTVVVPTTTTSNIF